MGVTGRHAGISVEAGIWNPRATFATESDPFFDIVPRGSHEMPNVGCRRRLVAEWHCSGTSTSASETEPTGFQVTEYTFFFFFFAFLMVATEQKHGGGEGGERGNSIRGAWPQNSAKQRKDKGKDVTLALRARSIIDGHMHGSGLKDNQGPRIFPRLG